MLAGDGKNRSGDTGVEIRPLKLPGLYLVIPARMTDARGFFSESWNRRRMAEHGLDHDFVQDNHSFSPEVGTLRGLHLQTPPAAQAKLVRCGRGRIFDVAVDLRRGSPTYGQWCGAELSFDNGCQMMVPEGFLHGFQTLEANSEVLYKCSRHYVPEQEISVRHDDPAIGIRWPLPVGPSRISSRDAAAMLLDDFDSPFRFDPEDCP
jgi:dTDP-4-dehydrorhamnose 3,5-epimerase